MDKALVSSMKTHVKGDKKLYLIDAQICDIITRTGKTCPNWKYVFVFNTIAKVVTLQALCLGFKTQAFALYAS